MGCGSSKHVEGVLVPYRPAATSFAVFDINAIEEPWVKQVPHDHDDDDEKEEKGSVGEPILEKLKMLDQTQAPQSWEEVSKTLQHLKPLITKEPSTSPPQKSKSKSFHTLEELDGKLKPKPNPNPEAEAEAEAKKGTVLVEPCGKRLQDNIFIVRDRLERQKEDKESKWRDRDRDPLSGFPENCPPGGADTVVLYTTSLGGVRKTFEDCNRARDVLEAHRVVFDERDVSLHAGFLRELKELVGETVALPLPLPLPRVFVKGRYVGGLEELVELNETGRLRRILNATRVERGLGRQACGGCGGARFVPCLECGGSCKVAVDGVRERPHKERCPKCNENGLVHCPACISLPS